MGLRTLVPGAIIDGLLLAALLFVGCSPANPSTATNGSAAPPPPPEVDAVPAHVQRIIEYREFVGRTAASSTVQVRARVSGYLRQSPKSAGSAVPVEYAPEGVKLATSQRHADDGDAPDDAVVVVSEGSLVTKGTLLFEIDPAPYRLTLAQAQGNLATSEALLNRYELDLARVKELLSSNTASRAEFDEAVSRRAETIGQIASLRAVVDRAKLDLEYTRVVAPISGLLGRTLVTNGNLINSDTTVLTTIVATAPIYVDFDVDENSLLDYRRRIREGSVKSARDTAIPIRMSLANEEGFPHAGTIDFVDNTTDPSTGNTRIRGTFANEDGALTPGLFARVQSPFSAEFDAVMIPTQAIAMDQQGRYVMVVDAGIAKRRSVQLGEIHGDNIVVSQGLKSGETVITNGLQKVRPGSPVRLSSPAAATQAPASETQTLAVPAPDVATNKTQSEAQTIVSPATGEPIEESSVRSGSSASPAQSPEGRP